jgi:flagellar motor switch protein FliN
MSSSNREIGAALVEELGTVLGALLDAQVQVTVGAPAAGPVWHAEIIVLGRGSGTFTVAIDAAGAAALTGQIMGLDPADGQAPAEAVIDTLREVCNQAIGALALKPIARGATLELGSLDAVAELEPKGEWSAHAMASDKLPEPVNVAVWGEVRFVGASAPASAASMPAVAPVAAAPAPAAGKSPADRIDVILDIDLPLTVRFGRTDLPLKALTRLGPGSLIDLGRSPDDPVEILVSNRVVAHGEVVIVSGNYGIRILNVVSPRDRLRSLEE